MDIAITREVSRSISNCELTFLERKAIDLDRARKQHALYEATLRSRGLAVLTLPEEPDMPDAVFVEDVALVLDECAIILRPGAESRRGETQSVAKVLPRFRDLRYMETPAHADGGDLLRLGRRIYMGVTPRSDTHAFEQLQRMLQPLGYDVLPVQVTGCLHLKSAATEVADGVVLVNPEWVDPRLFVDVNILEVDPSEGFGANTLRLGEMTVCSTAFPKTADRVGRAGIQTVSIEADELAKAEGALTCCSLIFSI